MHHILFGRRPAARAVRVLAATGVAMATLGTSIAISAAPAQAEARPLFRLPFPCGEQWQGKTYSGHAYLNQALDFNKRGTSGNADLGEEITASAGGTVRTWTESDGDQLLEIDHGGGWSTEYRHLHAWVVRSGTVAQGQVIARVGNRGTEHAHLHYEQQLNDRAAHIYFDGAAIDYYTGSGNGPVYTSHNCGVASGAGLAVTSRAVNRLDVFARNSSGGVSHRPWNGTTWGTEWTSLGRPSDVTFIGDPTAHAQGTSRIDLLATGSDRHVYHKTWKTATGWSGWVDIGGTVSGSPAVTSRYDGKLDLFVLDSEGAVQHRYYNGSSWSAAASLGKNSTAGPAAMTNGPNRMTVFARDADGSLLTRMWVSSSGWQSWVDRGGQFIGRPAASTRTGIAVDVFLRDTDGSLLHRYSSDGVTYTGETELGGSLHSSPAAVSWDSSRIDVLARSSTDRLHQHRWVSGSGWATGVIDDMP